ncbi:MAG: hypothetical protein FJX94_06750, partial [Bacteroidetes bacterium]|nr:hypothetical protein [Bacteroidota bacterium]
EKAGRGSKEVTVKDDDEHQDLKEMTLDELEKLLNEVLEAEDYIRAIAIRDEINTRKTKS